MSIHVDTYRGKITITCSKFISLKFTVDYSYLITRVCTRGYAYSVENKIMLKIIPVKMNIGLQEAYSYVKITVNCEKGIQYCKLTGV